MREVLEELGYDPSFHRSQGIAEELLEWADEIVCMGNVHYKYIQSNFGEHILNKTVLWKVDDPHFHKGTEKHREVAAELKLRILERYS
jgi:protein-tyrosine-phosphatase